MPQKFELSSECPPELAAFIKAQGTKVAAFKALGAGKETFNRVVSGGHKMPAEWLAKIERINKGESVAPEVSVPRPEPKFAPWDGTRRDLTIPTRGNKKKPRKFKAVPAPMADLLERYEGNISATARAMGVTGNSVTVILEGSVPFDDRRQRKVFEALHHVPSQGGDDEESYDQFALDMAIVQVQSKNYDRISDVADLLNGRRIFRTSTPVGWIVIYRIKGEDALKKFKRIAARDASKITCP